VKEMLDRVFCTYNWRLAFPEAEVIALPTMGSDHSPLLLTTDVILGRRQKSFTFEAFWLQERECNEVIENGHGTTKNLTQRLKLVSLALTKWSL